MARYIDSDALKKHIRYRFMRLNSESKIGLKECKEIDAVIDEEKEIKVFDRDDGAEPILETKTGLHHELHSDGHGKWHIQGELSFCSRCGQKIDWSKPKEEEKRRYESEKERQRQEWLDKTGHVLDNMNERRRIKYGVTEK